MLLSGLANEKATPVNIFNKSFDFLGENIDMDPPAPALKLNYLDRGIMQDNIGINRESVNLTPALNFFSLQSPTLAFKSHPSNTENFQSSKRQSGEESVFNLSESIKPVKESPTRNGHQQSMGWLPVESETKKNHRSASLKTKSPSVGKKRTSPLPPVEAKSPPKPKDVPIIPELSVQINKDYPNFGNLAEFLTRFFKSEIIEASSVDLKPYELSILKSFIARKFNKLIKSK
jgi:hypothetical protein